MNDELIAMMTLSEFSELLDAYGPNIAVWPEESRAHAYQLIDSDKQAHALHHSARICDGALSPSGNASSAPTGLLDAIMKRIQ
jgi:hypothetical protein